MPVSKRDLVPVLHDLRRIQARGVEDQVAVTTARTQPTTVAALFAVVTPLCRAPAVVSVSKKISARENVVRCIAAGRKNWKSDMY